MADHAAQIAKEAKSLHQALKESLKTRDVSDREVDIQRKNLRRQYLRLLFVHPYARESKDAENHLWMQTSYSLIAIYKQRITALDRAMHHPPRQSAQQSHQQQPPRAVEYRRLLQRFRQFLSEEEKFWTQLVLRFRRHFALDESQPALTALGIVPEEEPMPSADGTTRRNQLQFPPESEPGSTAAASLLPTTPAQRDGRIAIISKALVCLGDIARYKELYNEAGGRPRAGHEDGPPAAASTARSGRGRRGGGPPQSTSFMTLPRLRNYDRAQSCYEQARLLLPFDGNPSHQLAILSSYQKDVFGSLVHYYRALCVRTPYETAAENLGTVLNKAFEQYQAKGLVREREKHIETADGTPAIPRLRVEAFKEKVIVLHSMWNLSIDEAKELGRKVVEDFSGLVSDRILPIDMISKVIILLQGALWKHRMLRRLSHGEKRSVRVSVTESQIVSHLIATHRVLLHNGLVELTESPPEDAAEHDLAQLITATFRRTLPALRMAGKWLRSNTRYISQGRKIHTHGSSDASTDANKGREKRGNTQPVVIGELDEFWTAYTRFCDTLIHAFPIAELPEMRIQLEEDIEMAGFLPLRKYMYGSDGKPPGSRRTSTDDHEASIAANDSRSLQDRSVGRDQVHPNEEQLMRIADILVDAKAVAEDENTPMMFDGSSFLRRGLHTASHPGRASSQHLPSLIQSQSQLEPRALPTYLPTPSELDDDSVSIRTRTDDDPVAEAFSHVLRSSNDADNSDDEQIVWQPSRLSPEVETSFTPLSTISPTRSPPGKGNNVGAQSTEHLSPLLQQMQLEKSPPLVAPPTTAEDLVNSMQRTSASIQHVRQQSVQPVGLPLLGNSIWSPTGNSRHHISLGNGSSYASPALPLSGPPLAPHSTLDSSQTWQHTVATANTIYGYAVGPTSLHGSHQRVPSQSSSSLRSSVFSTQRQGAHFSPSLYGAGQVSSMEAADGGIAGPLPTVGYEHTYTAAPNSSFYHQPQVELYSGIETPAQQLRKEQSLHSPFPGSTISNIWGSPG